MTITLTKEKKKLDPKVEALMHELRGDLYKKNGRVHDAKSEYIAAGAAEKLIECAATLLRFGGLKEAQECYAHAKKTMPPKVLIEWADYHFREGHILYAQEMYFAAGQKENVVSCAQQWIANGNYCQAEQAYKLAGMEVPRRDRLTHANNCMKKKEYHIAADMYATLGDREKLCEVGRLLLLELQVNAGLKAYAAASTTPPHTVLIACGDACVEKGYLHEAITAYNTANNVEKVLECATRAATLGFVETVVHAYQLLNRPIPRDLLLTAAELCMQMNWKERVNQALQLVAEMDLAQSVK
jgi:tetratricopeptide (TPR) repeat protein